MKGQFVISIMHGNLKNNIENPANTILIVGFMAQNTLGRRIVEQQPEVKIFGDRYKLKAQVAIMNAFSAHASLCCNRSIQRLGLK